MPERDYRYRIGAQDDASSVFAKVSSSAKREMGKVDKAFDEAENAGKAMARAMSAIADDLDSELTGTARAADKLGEALGPDLRAKIGDAGLDRFVTDLRTAGVTFDEIEAECDELAASLKKLDDVHTRASGRIVGGLNDMDTAVTRVGDSTERSRGVFANFAGNASQDIPGINNSFGALNVAVGQFAEYATEGDIKLRKMAAAAATMGVLTSIIGGVTSELNAMNKAKAFDRDQVDSWAQGIREGQSAVDAMVSSMTELGKVEFGLGGFDAVQDFTPALAAAGVTMAQFGQLTQASDEQLATWRAQMLASGVDSEHVGAVLIAVGQAQDQLTAATAASEAAQTVFHGSIVEVNAQLEENRRRNDEARTAIEGRNAAILAGIGGDIAYRESVRASNEALAAYNQTASSGTAEAWELSEAQDAAASSVLAVASAAADNAADLEEMAGGEQTAGERAAVMVTELQKVAATLAPGSPLRVQIEGYIQQLGRIPRNITTTVHTQAIPGGPVPRFHDGGEYKAPPGKSEGLALLKDGEIVVDPSKSRQQTPSGGFGADVAAAIDEQTVVLASLLAAVAANTTPVRGLSPMGQRALSRAAS